MSQGRNIDWDNLGPGVADYLRSHGFSPGKPVHGPDLNHLKMLGLLEKPKRKQQGRGESQLEQDFAWHLAQADISESWVKPFILRIGPDMTFEPDFMVEDREGAFWIIDTKGPHSWEDSRIKIKIAAEKFPMWRWLIVTRPKGVWRAKEVDPVKGIPCGFIDLPWLE